MQINAPYPAVDDLIFIPDPQLRDGVKRESTVLAKQMMNGDTVTTIRRQSTVFTYSWSFELFRYKAIEFFEFYNLYFASMWEIIDHNGNILRGYIKLNPLELEMLRRSVSCGNKETSSLSFDFEVA